MAVLTQTEIQTLVLELLQANVTTDKPVDTAAGGELERALNDAYSMVWELEGGGIRSVASATAWTGTPTVAADGRITGILQDIKEIRDVWATLTSGSTGGAAGDILLDPVDLAEINGYRRDYGQGTYGAPQMAAVTRLRATANADVNKFRLDVWPGAIGYYFPIEYITQFIPLDGATITTPDVTDLGSRDIACLAAIDLAPRTGRSELVPTIALRVSDRAQALLERKLSAHASGDQDR